MTHFNDIPEMPDASADMRQKSFEHWEPKTTGYLRRYPLLMLILGAALIVLAMSADR